MKNKMLKKTNGITLPILVVTVIVILILAGTTIYNANGTVKAQKLTHLFNDLDLLREKVEDYYEEYGEIPAEIEYSDVDELYNVLSKNNDRGRFYVIDLEAMQGISLNYGRDYEKIKNDPQNATNYKDVYIINVSSHNIFYVQGITVKGNNGEETTYYTDYTSPDETIVDLRYVNGVFIPDGYYYIGKAKNSSGNGVTIISTIKDDKIDSTSTNQYTWVNQISKLTSIPDDVKLSDGQTEEDFLTSANKNQGYFKNSEGKVAYSTK